MNEMRARVLVTLTPLEELLLLLDLSAITSRRPELDAATPPAHGFTQSAEQLAPTDRAARAVAETAYAAAIDNYRNFQRLKGDVATLKQWYIDLNAGRSAATRRCSRRRRASRSSSTKWSRRTRSARSPTARPRSTTSTTLSAA
jgi:hypothetical protein